MHVDLYGRHIELGPRPSGLAVKRWTGKLSPEPETQAWIDSLPPGDTFFDVGASVGTFSVRACLRGLHVHAFEPVLSNYTDLCEVIRLNSLSITAYRRAISERSGIGSLGPGRSTTTLHPHGAYPDTVVVLSLDDYCRRNAVLPDHVKIDVDGDDFRVIKGMREVLPHVKSMLVEVDPMVPDNSQIPSYLESRGFKYDTQQVEQCTIKSGKYAGTANWIFHRVKQ